MSTKSLLNNCKLQSVNILSRALIVTVDCVKFYPQGIRAANPGSNYNKTCELRSHIWKSSIFNMMCNVRNKRRNGTKGLYVNFADSRTRQIYSQIFQIAMLILYNETKNVTRVSSCCCTFQNMNIRARFTHRQLQHGQPWSSSIRC
jgi:hypothetical protein